MSDYPYIRAYGKYVGFSEQKIESYITRAKKENQPQNVVVPFNNEVWTIFEHYSEYWQKILTKDI